MSLSQKYIQRVKTSLGLDVVWLPGTQLRLGDILERDHNQILVYRANLESYGIAFSTIPMHRNTSFDFQAQGVKTRIIQAGAEVSPYDIDVNVKAAIEIEFNKEETYYIKSTNMDGSGIKNKFKLGKDIVKERSWRHRRYYVVTEIYTVDNFVFFGSESRDRKVEIAGKGDAILNYINTGLSTDLVFHSSQNVDFQSKGESGSIAMRVNRIRKNGGIWK